VASAADAAAQRRMPFVLMLCGLLGGALVCALVISTTLAEGSFQITKLQDSTSALTRQRQVLEQQVAQAQSAQVIAQRASKLGLRRPDELLFLDLKTGKTTNDGPTWSGAVNAPGYAP
jgi:cell division protein FtsB